MHGSQPPTCAGHVPWQLGLLPYPQSRSVGADWQKTHSETLVLYFSQPDQSGKETEFCPWPVEIEIRFGQKIGQTEQQSQEMFRHQRLMR